MEACDFEANTVVRQTTVKDGDDFVIDVFATEQARLRNRGLNL